MPMTSAATIAVHVRMACCACCEDAIPGMATHP
jgi:hypothetical protein